MFTSKANAGGDYFIFTEQEIQRKCHICTAHVIAFEAKMMKNVSEMLFTTYFTPNGK